MSRVTVNISNQPAPATPGADVSRWAVAGLTERGSVTAPIVLRSLADYTRLLGSRVTYGVLYDCAEVFFREAGSRAEMIVGRVVGPDAEAATRTFNDGSANPAAVATAVEPGSWGNSITCQITAGSEDANARIWTIRYAGTVVETSPELADVTAAVAWSLNSDYIRITDPGAVGDPAAIAATALTGGDDDRDNIVTDSWEAPLTLAAGTGGRQLSAPGSSSAGVQNLVLDIAEASNSVALLDSVPGGSAEDIAAQYAAITSDGKARGAILAPWATGPGLTASTSRTVPYSAVQAGMTARSDRRGGEIPLVNDAVAGENGVSRWATGLETEFTTTELATLDAAQIIAARIDEQGRIQTWGDRTLADEDTDPQWYQLQGARTIMYVAHRARQVGVPYVFRTLDPRLRTANAFKGDLQTILAGLYPAQIGNDPTTSVSTSQDTSTRVLSGSLSVQPNPAAEAVAIDVLVEVS